MKVAQINAVYGFSSTGTIVQDLDCMLQEEGIESLVAYQKTNSRISNGYKIGNVMHSKWHAMWTRISGKQGYASKSATKRLIKWLKKERPDIVHLHNLHSNYVNLKLLLGYLSTNNIKTVLTLHDCWFFTGKCFHYVEDNCYKWETLCRNCPRNKKDVPSLFFDSTEKSFTDKKTWLADIDNLTIVGCSDWICKEAKRSFLGDRRIVRIYNGVDQTIFKPFGEDLRAELGIEKKFVILGMANKWLLKENEEIVQAIIASLRGDEILLLGGCTETQMQSFCNHPNVLPMKYTTSREYLAKIYKTCDVFVNLTRAEVFGLVNAEALSCGTPVITYNSGGSPECVNETCGKVVEQGDLTGVFEALKEIKGNLEKYKVGAVEFSKRFNKDVNYEKYLALYKELVEEK